jgi:Tfp pilus assembly protein PilN
MRAINLIPAPERRGAGGAAGRSGGGVYILLGALALLVVAATAYVVTGKSVTDKQNELARVTHQAEVAEAKVQGLTAYTRFASVRATRVDTVKQLAAGRFDWSHALREVSRVLPKNAWLTQMTGTTTPGGLGGGNSLRAALPVPAIELQGCTTSQSSVAKMMARMRLIDGVQRVSLSDADKGAKKVGSAGVSTGGSSGGGDCRGHSNHFPMFNLVVFFEPSAVPAPTAAGGTTQTVASTTAPASTTTPSSAASGGTTP